MKIASLCQRRIVTIESSATPVAAAGLMREHHVGTLVVTTESAEGSRVVGIVTDRDLVVDVLARGAQAEAATIGELAHRPLAVIAEDADSSAAVEVMRTSGVRRLLVVDARQHLAGIVALDDLLQSCANEMAALADVARSGAERESARHASAAPPPLPRVHVPALGTAGWGVDTM